MARTTKSSNLSDEQKAAVETLAKGWRGSVRRGDCTAEYAAQEVAANYTYPYAEQAHWSAVLNHARKNVR